MKAAIFVLCALLGVMLTGCSRTGTKTYKYLREVGHVRLLYNTDAQRRIPDIRQLQFNGLLDAARRTEEYKQTLEGLSTEGIDPEAVQFAQNLESFLGAVKGMYFDTARLMQDEQKARGRHFGPSPLMPILKGGAAVYSDNIGGLITAIGELMDGAQKSMFLCEKRSTGRPHKLVRTSLAATLTMTGLLRKCCRSNLSLWTSKRGRPA